MNSVHLRTAKRIIATTPLLEAVDRVEHLLAGYSTDTKYVLWEADRPKYLLRLSDIGLRDRVEKEFVLLGKLHGRGVLTPEPQVFGATEDGNFCFSVRSYIPGQTAEKSLPTMSDRGQFSIGEQARRELNKLHQLPCIESDVDWPRYNLYVAMNIHWQLGWAFRHAPKLLTRWRGLSQEIIDTHDFEDGGPPHWFAP